MIPFQWVGHTRFKARTWSYNYKRKRKAEFYRQVAILIKKETAEQVLDFFEDKLQAEVPMKIKEEQRIEISDCSVQYILELLSDRGISPEQARIEKEVDHEYNSYGDDYSYAYVYLTFTEEFDGKKFKTLVEEDKNPVVYRFTRLFCLGCRISGLRDELLAEKLGVEPFDLGTWKRGSIPTKASPKSILDKLSEVILQIEG